MNTFYSLFFMELLAVMGCRNGDAAERAAERARGGSNASKAPEPEAPNAASVVAFWHAAGPQLWFAKDPAFDRRFRERFGSAYEAAVRGELSDWQQTPEGALALILLLDQYPRNSFRGSARMYESDARARAATNAALAAGLDRSVDSELRVFIYLPLGHSEDLADQERCVALARALGPVDLAHAEHHRDIVRRFGRFPHRNAILGRASRPEEVQYLADGGYAG